RFIIGLHLVAQDTRRTHDLLRRNAVDALGENSHEFHATAGNNKGLETVGAEIDQQLQHRLVHELGVEAIKARVASGVNPVGDDLGKIIRCVSVWVTAMILRNPVSPSAANALISRSSTALNGCLVFQSGCLGASALTRSIANMIWKYIGCSAHKVPSWSEVAIRSAGAT